LRLAHLLAYSTCCVCTSSPHCPSPTHHPPLAPPSPCRAQNKVILPPDEARNKLFEQWDGLDLSGVGLRMINVQLCSIKVTNAFGILCVDVASLARLLHNRSPLHARNAQHEPCCALSRLLCGHKVYLSLFLSLRCADTSSAHTGGGRHGDNRHSEVTCNVAVLTQCLSHLPRQQPRSTSLALATDSHTLTRTL